MITRAPAGALERMMQGHSGKGELTAEVARLMLSWAFADDDQARVSDLSAKARAGALTDDEARELDWYMLAGDLLTILHSKARVALSKKSSAA